jgi:autotransporter-associated beta strand protein
MNTRTHRLVLGTSVSALMATACHTACAAVIGKANNANNLNLTTSWTGGVVPGPTDVASWTSAVSAANATALGADLSWRGIEILDPAGPVSIGAGNTLTLGSDGISMGFASQDFTLGSNLTLAPSGQSWDVASGRVLTLTTGTFTRPAGAAVNLPGAGTVAATMTGLANVNGILGPWMTIGTGTDTRYATVPGGSIQPLTTATAAAAFGWPSGNNNTFNYDIAGVQGNLGVGRQANTARYTGVAATQNWGNNNTTTVTLNGLLNAGLGALTFSEAGGTSQGQIAVGTNNGNELVLAAASADLILKIPVVNTGATPGSVLITGPNTVNIDSAGGASTYTGSTTVASGTLLLNGAGSINGSSGISIRGANAKYIHASSVASTVPVTVTRGTLDGTGTLGAVTLGGGTGATLTHGNGGSGTLTMSSLTFGGAAQVGVTLSGSTPPLTVTGALSTLPANGQVTLDINSAPLANGLHNLISYGSYAGAASAFSANVISGLNSRQSSSLVLNGNNLALQVSGDTPKWTGALSGNWLTGTQAAPKNWRLITGGTATDFIAGDNVLFDDSATGTTVVNLADDISAGVIEFNNATKAYTLKSDNLFALLSGSIVKNGAGALTIENSNFHSGGLTFNAGTLRVNNDTALGSGPVTIGTGGTKTLDNTSGFAVISSNPNNHTWNDDFTFTGTNDLDLGSGTVTLAGAGTDRSVSVTAGTLGVGELKGAAHGFIKQGPGTLVVASSGAGAAASTLAGTLNVAAGTLQINRSGSAGATSGDFSATSLAGTGTILNGANDDRWLFINTADTLDFAGTLANGGTGGLGFNKQGTGSITLSGSLSYTGQTTVEGGTLAIASANTGTGTNAVVNSGLLTLGNPAALGTPVDPALPNSIRLAGNAVSTVDLAHDGGGPTYGFVFGTTTVATVIANRATPGEGLNHSLTTVGIAGVGGGTITFVSGGNVTSGSGRVTFPEFGLSAGSVQTTVLNPTTANVTLGNVAKVANATLNQTLELGGTATGNEITGLISNGGGTAVVAITKSNSGTWTISGANNTYSGGTVVGTANGAGILRATATNALGTGTILFDASGGAPGPSSRLEIAGDITLPNAITLSQRNNDSAQIVSSGNNTLSGNVDVGVGGAQARIQSDSGLLTLSGAITTTAGSSRNLHLAGAGNGVISGVISNNASNAAAAINLHKQDSGTWTLSGANTTTGTTTVNGGTLAVAQPVLSDTAAVSVAATATLHLPHGATDTVDRLFIDGVEQAAGTWGGLASSATNKTARITGTGILLASNGATPPGGFASWAGSLGLTAGNNGVGVDAEGDGFDNGIEYILGGDPLSGSNNPKVYSLLADSTADGDTTRELVLTIAVPQGTHAFPAGSPVSTVTYEGFGITVRGSTDLAGFPVAVTPVDPVTTGLPAAPVQGGITYEYRSFSLAGSNGLGGKGFLQVSVTNP